MTWEEEEQIRELKSEELRKREESEARRARAAGRTVGWKTWRKVDEEGKEEDDETITESDDDDEAMMSRNTRDERLKVMMKESKLRTEVWEREKKEMENKKKKVIGEVPDHDMDSVVARDLANGQEEDKEERNRGEGGWEGVKLEGT